MHRGARATALLLAMLAPYSEAFAQKKPGVEPYALIFGTVFGPDDRTLYGVPVKVRRADQKKPKWEQTSDHRGEFAVRVPAGKADYIVWTDVDLPKLLKRLGRDSTPRDAAPAAASSQPAAPAVKPASSATPEQGGGATRTGREANVHIE